MKIVVVGGTGLIGTKVVELLGAGPHEVVAASRATGVNAFTGEGLAEALDGASVVIDVSNSGYLDEAAALEYFEGATLNLLNYGAAEGIRHHVALSIVGTDRLAAAGGGYFRAKQLQERLIRGSGRPYSIVHATQFFEFVPWIAASAADGDHAAVTTALMQPMAAADVAAAVIEVATADPMNGMVEFAGPERRPLAEFVRLWLHRMAPDRRVEVDPLSRYFGSLLHEGDLLPGPDATTSSLTYREWLAASAPGAADPSDAPRRMKALRAHSRGGPEQLTYEDAPVPDAPDGSEVTVDVTAAAVTFDELTWDETWEADGVDRTPIIPSHEFAGVVAAIGPDVRDLAVGDAVFGLVPFDRDGAAAEVVRVPADHVAHRPANVSDVVAAAAVLPALTAAEALGEPLGLAPRERLLIRGGTGAVGSFLVQFARRMGIEVTATVRSQAAVPYAERLGAHHVLVGDEPDAIGPATFDGAIDAVGAGTPEWLYRSVRPGRPVITLQEAPDADLAQAYGVDARFFLVSAEAEQLRRLATLLADGDVDVAVAQVFPLSEGRAAYASRGEAGRRPGKTVLAVTR